jgi:hypothetical protein
LNSASTFLAPAEIPPVPWQINILIASAMCSIP